MFRNPVKAAAEKLETSVKTGVQERVRTHFQENKRTYIACASTAIVVAAISRKQPVVHVTVVNNLP